MFDKPTGLASSSPYGKLKGTDSSRIVETHLGYIPHIEAVKTYIWFLKQTK